MAKRIYLVTGDRDWTGVDHENRMCHVFQKLVPGSIILHGDARGADDMATDEAFHHGMFPCAMPYAGFLGRGGGPARNRKMLTVMVGLREAGWATRVLAFHDNITKSKGTKDMLQIALEQSFIATLISINSAQTLRATNDLRKLLKGA